jgi:hypothetical protein
MKSIVLGSGIGKSLTENNKGNHKGGRTYVKREQRQTQKETI